MTFLLPVQTTFNHLHGSVTSFELKLVDDDDGSNLATLELGLDYLDIPQPAGHHSTVFTHALDRSYDAVNLAVAPAYELSGDNTRQAAYLNALEVDREDDAVPVVGAQCGTRFDLTSGANYCWSVTLHPQLAMGLDLDLAREGRYQVPIATDSVHPAAHLEGEVLFVVGDGTATRVAELAPSAEQDLLARTTAMFEGLVRPLPEADFIPPQPGADLIVLVRLIALGDNPAELGPHHAPSLLPGGLVELPLLDFEPPVQDAGGDGAIGLELAAGLADGSPGVQVTIENRADHVVRIGFFHSLQPAGGQVAAPAQLLLKPHERRTVEAHLSVPGGVEAGQMARLVIGALDLDAPEHQVLARIQAEPTDLALTSGGPDRASQGSPFSLLVPLLAIALAALARRRRQE